MRSGLTLAIASEDSRNEFPQRLEPNLSIEVFGTAEATSFQNRFLEFTP
jgi:hypothetical protein